MIILGNSILIINQRMQILQNFKDAVIIKFRFDVNLHFLLRRVRRNLIFDYGEHTIVISLNAKLTKSLFLIWVGQHNYDIRTYKTTFVKESNTFFRLINNTWHIWQYILYPLQTLRYI